MSVANEDLPGLLFDLSKDVLHLIEESEGIDTIEIQVPRKEVDLDYSPESRSVRSTQVSVTRCVWPPEIINAINNQVSELDSYQESIELLSDRIDTDRSNPQFLLQQFIQTLMSEAIGEIEDHNIINLISIFIAQIEGAPINWHPIVFLVGIDIGVESVEFDTGVTLRQPRAEDLEYERNPLGSSSSPFTRLTPARRDRVQQTPTAIIEFSRRVSSSDEITRIIDQHITTLHLYDVGSVTVVSREYNPEAIIPGFGQPGDEPVGHFRGFRFTVEEEDVERLLEFFKIMSDLVLERLIEGDMDSALMIAYDRYENALDEPRSEERQLTSAIMCLEALLLKESERGELSERLSRRTGILLHYFDFEPIKVSRKLQQAYQIRSKYVHGSKIEGEANPSSLAGDIMEYARRCLVTFLQLGDETDKADLLSKIDNASLHPNARDALNELLDEECEI